jgi:hypothetical protein
MAEFVGGDVKYVGVGEVVELTMKNILENLESLRIDVDTECQYSDPTGVLRDKYELANEMLDDCIAIIRKKAGF